MLLGGLWHGASFAFVLCHGAALIVNHGIRKILSKKSVAMWFVLPMGWALTQMTALLAWVPFRAETWADVGTIYSGFIRPLDMAGVETIAIPYALILLPILVDSFIVAPMHKKKVRRSSYPVLFWLFIGVIFALLLQIIPMEISSFIYFQF